MLITRELPPLTWIVHIGWRLYCTHVMQLTLRIAIVLIPILLLCLRLRQPTRWWSVFSIAIMLLATRIASIPAIGYLARLELPANESRHGSDRLRTLAFLLGTLVCELLMVFGPSVLVGGAIGSCVLADNSEAPCAGAMVWMVPLFFVTIVGMLWCALCCSFATHRVLFHAQHPPAALQSSWRLVQRHWRPVMGIQGISVAVLILSQLPTAFVARYINDSIALIVGLTVVGSTLACAFHVLHISLLYRLLLPPQPASSSHAIAT